MAANYWVSIKDRKKIAVFVAAVVVMVLFLESLPTTVGTIFTGRYGGRGFSLARIFVIFWVGGWFIYLFVRAEDRDIYAPIDYQGYCRLVGCLLIGAALIIAAMFVVGLLIYKYA